MIEPFSCNPRKASETAGRVEKLERPTNSAAIVTVDDVFITGTTAKASWGMPVREAKRKIAEGTEPRNSEAPERKILPIEAFLKLKP